MSIDETPEWIQRKVAVLMMTNDTPPTEPVEGVGHRIDKNTFGLFKNSSVSLQNSGRENRPRRCQLLRRENDTRSKSKKESGKAT